MTLQSIEKRLNLLEKKKGESRYAFVWKEDGETDEQAISRRFGGLPPANTELIICGWETNKEVGS